MEQKDQKLQISVKDPAMLVYIVYSNNSETHKPFWQEIPHWQLDLNPSTTT